MADSDIKELFLKSYITDKPKYIKKWLVTWDYQAIQKKRKVVHQNAHPADFHNFNGEEDLVRWMHWFAEDYPNYLPEGIIHPLIEKSKENDVKIINNLSLSYDFSNYNKRVGINNAHDYIIPQLYPSKNEIKTVLDFGAGYGRQANLWTSLKKDIIYIGMDAILNSYCLQNIYYKQLKIPVFDYVENPEKFKIDKQKKGIYHIPTWRYDLIPDNSIDLVICVQVLPELNPKLVKKMLKLFHRILKAGAALYIRDHASVWKPTGSFNTEDFLLTNGFVLEFKPHIILDKDLHGIPRIYRKIDKEVIISQTYSIDKRKKQFAENIDRLTRGYLKRAYKKLIK